MHAYTDIYPFKEHVMTTLDLLSDQVAIGRNFVLFQNLEYKRGSTNAITLANIRLICYWFQNSDHQYHQHQLATWLCNNYIFTDLHNMLAHCS